jgi:protein TonB
LARSKRKVSPILVVSLGAHLAVGAALALVPQETLREVVAIALQEAPARDEPPKPEPAKPTSVRHDSAARAARVPRTAAAPSQLPAAGDPRFTNFADLGLTLDSSSGDGIAVAVGGQGDGKGRGGGAAVTKPKVLVARKSGQKEGPPPTPRPLSQAGATRPQYTEEARRAGIEGRVVLELAIDEHGEVTAARVIDGLGYGLDEAAVAAAKTMRFAAAIDGGRPVASRFILSMRFVLGT